MLQLFTKNYLLLYKKKLINTYDQNIVEVFLKVLN